MRFNRPLVGGAAAVLLLLIVAGIALTRSGGPSTARADVMAAGLYNPPHSAPDFMLRGSNGSDVTLSRFRGKIVLLTFGFTSCAAVCPTNLATLAQTRKALGKTADRVQVVFVTVDPDRDGVAQLRDYVSAFDPTFVGATGTPEELAAARGKYGVTATKEGRGEDYAFAHTSSIFLIDPAGKLRAMMPFGHEAKDFVHDINLVLAS
ncbi:MAG: SCO family protein [Sphingomicrobium sp.]